MDPSHVELGKRKRSSSPSGVRKETLMKELGEFMNRETAKARLLAKQTNAKPHFPTCPDVTVQECTTVRAAAGLTGTCERIHLQPIIRPYTDPNLGHCSYLNTCYGEPSFKDSPSLSATGGTSAPRTNKDCRYLHFEVVQPPPQLPSRLPPASKATQFKFGTNLGPLVPVVPDLSCEPEEPPRYPASWVSCDVRKFDLSVLGKFDVIMADPPWEIHMSLPYGTITDDEMRAMPIASLANESSLLFLWVTARAIELGRDLVSHWGYRRVDEILWAKTNQLSRLIRTGRTGHWLNHTSEHLIVGLKSPAHPLTPETPNSTWPVWLQRGLDTDVLVSEVRETSRKPEEVYDLIERCCLGGRKLEIFGRKHNAREGWLTLGNQIDKGTGGDMVWEPELVERMKGLGRRNLAQEVGQGGGPAPATAAGTGNLGVSGER